MVDDHSPHGENSNLYCQGVLGITKWPFLPGPSPLTTKLGLKSIPTKIKMTSERDSAILLLYQQNPDSYVKKSLKTSRHASPFMERGKDQAIII